MGEAIETSIKITISYERPEELKEALERLGPMVRSCKASRRQQGRFKKAYIMGEAACCPIQKPEKT